jgi:hypothetical protein
VKLVLEKSEWLPDWYLIDRADHDGREWDEQTAPNCFRFMRSARLGSADIEGTADEMRAIAQAIRNRGCASFRRCHVEVLGDVALFCSPRNSEGDTPVPLADADELAAQIERELQLTEPRSDA